MIHEKGIGRRIFNICNTVLMLLIVFACFYPFYYMIIYSFSDSQIAVMKGITWKIEGFTLENYITTLTLDNFVTGLVVSVFRTLAGVGISLLCCSFYAYLMTIQKMYFRKFLYRGLVLTMYINGGLIPIYMVYRAYGLANNYLIYLLPTALTAYNTVLIKTFMEQIPSALEESAMLDGAGYLTRYTRIIMPLSKPILATIAVFVAVGQWNSWFDSHIYVTKEEMWSLQYILYRYLQQVSSAAAVADERAATVVSTVTPATVRMTITAVVTAPILIVYPYMQKYFTQGIMVGAIKG